MLFRLTDSLQNVISESRTTLQVPRERLVQLQAPEPYQLLAKDQDSLQTTIRLRNAGNTTEVVKVVGSAPAAVGRRFFEYVLTLAASADTILTVGIRNDRTLQSLEQFSFTFSALYDNSELIGSATVQFENVTSARRFPLSDETGMSDLWFSQQNKVSLIARNTFTGMASWQLNANGNYHAGSGKISFNTNAYQSGMSGTRPLLSNTWMRFEKNQKGLLIGNITENLEKFVVGRGIKFHLADTARAIQVEAGVADKSFNLIGDHYRPAGGGGVTAFVKAQSGQTNGYGSRYSGIALYDRDPFENSESLLFSNTLRIGQKRATPKTRVELQVVPAVSRPILTTPEVGVGPGWKPSLATGLQLATDIRRFSVSSINFYSTAYYPGIRRGALQLNQRIGRRFNQVQTWASYHLFENEPASFSPFATTRSYFLTSRTEVGVSFPVSPFVYVSIAPRQESEKGRYAFLSQENTLREIHASNLTGTVSWRSRNARYMTYLSAETGTVTSPFTSGKTLHSRANLSLSHRWLTLNATLQHGNYTLIETINNWYGERGTSRRLALSAIGRQALFDRKVQAEWGINYFKDNFSGENWLANTSFQYKVTPKTSLLASVQLFRYSSYFFRGSTNVNFQTGIVQALPTGRQHTGDRTDLLVRYFYDTNGNNQQDEGEEPAQQIVVKIGTSVFITDEKGEIRYQRLPEGEYPLSMIIQHGWYAPDSKVTVRGKKAMLAVPLKRSGTLSGSLRFRADARISKTAIASVEGYTIIAKDPQGNTYRTRTDETGRYLLFLPENDYEVFVSESALQDNILLTKGTQSVRIEAAKINDAPPFELGSKEKKIEIKRFSAP